MKVCHTGFSSEFPIVLLIDDVLEVVTFSIESKCGEVPKVEDTLCKIYRKNEIFVRLIDER